MALKPLNDNVVLKPLSKEEVTASGIIIPDTVDKERPERGEVVAVGPGKLLENGNRAEISVKAGDKVVFKKYAPDEIEIDKEEYLVVSAGDIIAVIE
jgi:chaperonin GroES